MSEIFCDSAYVSSAHPLTSGVHDSKHVCTLWAEILNSEHMLQINP